MIQPGDIQLDVAILGGGFAGVYCAKALRKALGKRSPVRIGLISEDNFMAFQPMLPEVASSSVSPRHVVNPLRLLCRDVEVLRGRVESIDWPGRRLSLHAGPFAGHLIVKYEHLVLTLGAQTNLSRIPGMPEHAFLLKNAGDAMLLRATLIERIEAASLEQRPDVKRRLLSFVVVGGGYSGVEIAGHILGFFHSIRGFYRNISAQDLQLCLVHDGDHLLPTMSRRLGEYCAAKLSQQGLKIILRHLVKSVTANRVRLDDGTIIETNTVICTVGNAPHPLVTDLAKACGLETIKGRPVAEPTGQIKGQTQLWAAGDCAAFPAPQGGPSPATAQFALRQGALVGKNLARLMRREALEPFRYKGLGEMASIGHHRAVAEIMGFKFYGFFAWWLWRTVYLLKLPRLDRKIRVLLDWTLDLFFPRDINHLSPRYSSLLTEIHLEAGDVLFQSGEPAFSFYMVKSGVLEIRDGEETVQVIDAGGYFGEQALSGDAVWHYEAVAREATQLVSVPLRVFQQLVQGVGSLGQFFQKSATKYQSREVVEAIGHKIPAAVASQPIERLMERKLYTLGPHMTMQQALQVTRSFPRSSYPVVDERQSLLGTVSREDFYEFIKRQDTTPETTIDHLRFTQVPTVAAGTSIGEVMRCFIRTGSNKVLVVDNDRHLQGIATVMDLMAAVGTHDGHGNGGHS